MEYIYELPTMWSRRRTSSRHRAEGGHSFFHFSFLGRIKDFCYIHAVPVSYLRMSNPLNCLYNLLQIWRIAPTPKNDKYQYTHFAHKINSFDTAPKNLLPSDSRLRPDRYALEMGDMSKSSAEKSRYCPFISNSDHSSVAPAVSFYDRCCNFEHSGCLPILILTPGFLQNFQARGTTESWEKSSRGQGWAIYSQMV